MNKDSVIEFLELCEEVYQKDITKTDLRSRVAVEVGSMSITMSLSGHQDLLLEIIEEYKDKLEVVQFLGDKDTH